jgi:thiol-disulfide isomerase/thioredoxin
MNRRNVLILGGFLSLVIGISIFGFKSPEIPPPSVVNQSELVDKDNGPVDFSEFKGKVVFVNNWASWCPPCVAEMPSIQKLKNEVNNPDLVFVMVSFDEEKEKAMAFMSRKKLDFDVYFPGKKYPYATSSIPATFLIDRSGKMIGNHVGMADYSDEEFVSQVKTLLAKK